MLWSSLLKFEVKTLDAAALKDAACKLAQLAQEFQPNIIIGIRSGGYHVASLITEQFSGTPIFSITCRRPVTAPKQKYLTRLLRKLPYSVTNRLRICEHILLTQFSSHSMGEMALDEAELAPLRAHLGSLSSAARILIVDDAVDSGVTMAFVHKTINAIANTGAVIKMAAITVTTASPLVEPDFSLYRYAICRFPWSLDTRS